MLEGFTALTYLSALHPTLKFGSAVFCQSFRNPALLAKMTATLQFLSGGRFILGLGAGWHQEEYEAYGYEFPPGLVRVEQLEEAVQIIQKMWQEETVTFAGRHYRVTEARCEPRPSPAPPIMIGAFQPKMLRLTATYADWWNVSSTSPSRYQPMVARLEQYCHQLGKDLSSIRQTWIGGCACAPTRAQAVAFARDQYGNDQDFGFVGTPEQVIEQMMPFIELGVRYFMFDCADFPGQTTLEMLIFEVLPRLNEFH